MNAHRTLAVAAAALFVGAVALATVGPNMVSLADAVSWCVPNGAASFKAWMLRTLGSWAWEYLARPLMIRPAWLPFGSLSLLCAGAALSWPGGDAARRSHRRS